MNRLATLAAVAGMVLTAPVLAHENHSAKPAVAEKKEQQPWGIAGDAKAAKRTIEIAMTDDMRFTPSAIAVTQGETVKLVVRNRGKVLHEMVIGDRKTLDQHAAMMVKFPAMEHDEPYMAHVAAGKEETLVWNFNRAGDFHFACLIAGHFQAGMVGTIQVAQQAAATDMTEGEVRKVDKATGKITLKHGEIKGLDMPPMTMVFGVSNAAMLDQVKAGDKIRFRASNDGGKFTVTEIQPATN